MLTPGQERIRALVLPHVAAYWAAEDANDRATAKDIIRRVRQQVMHDPFIIKDRITGASLYPVEFSPHYLRWLENNSTAQTLRGNYPLVQLDHFVYRRDEQVLKDHGVEFRFDGGVEWSATFHAIFSLAADRPVDAKNTGATYYMRSGILKVDFDGNHRLLGHVLWGEPRIQTESMEIRTEQVDPDLSLNKAFQVLDEVAPRLDVDYHSRQEISQVANFAIGSDADQRTVLAEYFQHAYRRGCDQRRYDEPPITWLIDRLVQLQEIQDRPPQPAWLLSIQRKISRVVPSPFEQWYQNRQKAAENDR